jgi:hypothetical protein
MATKPCYQPQELSMTGTNSLFFDPVKQAIFKKVTFFIGSLAPTKGKDK